MCLIACVDPWNTVWSAEYGADNVVQAVPSDLVDFGGLSGSDATSEIDAKRT